jgi:hypothetical protein
MTRSVERDVRWVRKEFRRNTDWILLLQLVRSQLVD